VATRTNSSISANASSSSSSPSSCGRRGGQPGDIRQRFAAFIGQRRRSAGGKAETTEESAAPVEQCTAALRQGGVGIRINNSKPKPRSSSCALVAARMASSAPSRGACGRSVVGHDLRQPVRRIGTIACEPAAQRAVQFGGA
jgi:hypothetical protein